MKAERVSLATAANVPTYTSCTTCYGESITCTHPGAWDLLIEQEKLTTRKWSSYLMKEM